MNEQESTINNIENSTDAAISALTQLRNSLIQGRFKEGVKAYQTMCNTLASQKIWMSDKTNNNIKGNFHELASIAGDIVEILKPYVDSLEKLAYVADNEILNNINEHELIPENTKTDNARPKEQESLILKILKDEKGKISYSKLRSKTGYSRNNLDEYIQQLSKDKKVKMNNISGRKIIQIPV